MSEALKSLLGAPIPKILLLFGLLLIVLAIVGRIRGRVALEKASRLVAGTLGIIFVSLGLFMHLREDGTA